MFAPTIRVSKITAALVACVWTASAQSPSIGGYRLQSERRIDRTNYEYSYKADLTNPSAAPLANVSATVVSANAAVTVLENTLEFGAVAANSVKTSTDTFTIRMDRSVAFQASFLQWTIRTNRPPVASAGADQTVATGQTVALNGAASSDPDGNPLTYVWSFVSRPGGSTATIVNANTVNPTFTADRFGAYTVRLIVNDGFVNSAPDDMLVSTQNSRPVANAGPDQSKTVGSLATLNGSASSDVDGQPLTFAWTLVQRPAGSAAALNNPAIPGPTFTVDVAGAYRAQLIVNDGLIDSLPDEAIINTSNTPPVANAGANQSVPIGQLVTLNGSGSSDADGNPLTYSWSFTTRPAGSAATLSNPTAINPTFVPDRSGAYVAQLIVNDGFVNSTAVTVQITTANTPPVANAGLDQTVTYLSTVTLNGSASSDVDGNPLTYTWSITSRPAGSISALSNPAAVNPTFLADRSGTFVAQLIVNDGVVNSVADTVTITTNNSAPSANAGPDQAVNAGATAQLNGAGSSDADGNPLTYAWSFTSRPPGSGATLSNPAAVNPSFAVDLPGSYVVQLIVSDGLLSSAADTVTISTNNLAPSANAGPDQGVNLGATVQLSGAASTDPENSALTYTWSLTSRPAGSTAALSSTSIVNPIFVADVTGTYVAQLIVSDGQLASAPDTVTISTTNRAPVANAGPAQSVNTGATVQLTGAASSDPDGNPLTYIWTLTTRPAGSAAALGNTAIVNPTFVADLSGTYTAQLTVSDGSLASAAASVTITTINRAPVANAGPGQSVNVASTVQLTGAASSDPDGNPLTYAWTLTARPVGSTAALNNAAIVNPTFVADLAGTYTAQLIVSDGSLSSPAATVTITTINRPPVANAGPDQTVTAGALVNLTGAASSDPDGTTVTYLWTLVTRPAGSNAALTGATTATPSFTPDLTGAYTARLVVNDGTASSPADDVIITASALPALSLPVTVSVPFTQTAGITVTLPAPAGALGVVVTVTSSDTSKVTVVSATVNIASGASTGSATLNGVALGTSTITASAAGYTNATSTATVTAALNITNTSLTFTPGFPGTLNVRLEVSGTPVNAPTGGAAFALTAADPTCVANIASASIPAGQNNVNLTLNHGGGATLPCTTLLTVAGGALLTSDALSVNVNPNQPIALPSLPVSIGELLQGGPYIVRLPISNHGGKTVTLTSSNVNSITVSNSSATLGAVSQTIVIPDGSTDGTFVLHAGGGTGTVTITASAPGFANGVGTVNIVTPAVLLTGLASSISVSAADQPFTVQVGVPNAGNTALAQVQAVRASSTLTATVTNSAAAVAQLTTTAGSAQSRTVTIGAGQSQPTNGVSFDPLTPGDTNVVAAIGGFLSIPASPGLAVSVTGGTIAANDATVGAGLSTLGFNATLSGTTHGGVTMHIESANPAKVLVSLNQNTAGTASVDQFVPNGSQQVQIYVHGVENQTGPVTLNVSAPGFAAATSTITVVQPVVEILLSSPHTAQGANVSFQVRTTTIAGEQPLRAGSAGLTVTVANSNAAVAQLVNGSGPGQSRTSVIAANASRTTDLFFDPISPGDTTVSTTAPGFTTNAQSSALVTVTGSSIAVNAGLRVGAGLMTEGFGNMGGAVNGAVTLQLQSGNSGQLLLSAGTCDPGTPGTATATITVPNGGYSFQFCAHGVAAGTPLVTASASGFGNGNQAIAIVPPAAQINIPTTFSSLSVNSAFQILLGATNTSGTGLQGFQSVRSGSSLTVSVANSNAVVARLVNGPDIGQSLNITFAAGEVNKVVEFDPLAAGATTVSATGAGFASIPGTTTQDVTVTAPAIATFPTSVGSGLMTSGFASLGGGAHGGVTVRVQSSNAALVRVSVDTSTVGATFVDIPIANGQTQVFYVVHALENVTGSATLTLTAAGFANGTGTVTVVQPLVELVELQTTLSTVSANQDFQVRVGLGQSGFISPEMPARVGGPGVTVSVTSSAPGVGRLFTAAVPAGGGTVTVSISAGASRSNFGVASGGVQLDALAVGTTTVAVTAPGFIPADYYGSQVVTVNPASITPFGQNVLVGAGLMNTGCCGATLSGAAHGGVTMTVTSLDPSRVLVSLNDGLTAGATSFNVVVPDGQTFVSLALHGVNGAAQGSANIQMSAPGFSTVSFPVNLVAPALAFIGFSGTGTLPVTSPDVSLLVMTGVADPSGTGVVEQPLRLGGPAVTITMQSSNAAAGVIVIDGTPGASRTATVAAGASRAFPFFRPVAPGNTTISVSAPGYTTTNPGGVQILQITP